MTSLLIPQREIDRRGEKANTNHLFLSKRMNEIRDENEFERVIFYLKLQGHEFDEKHMRELFRREYDFHTKMKRRKMSYSQLHAHLRTRLP